MLELCKQVTRTVAYLLSKVPGCAAVNDTQNLLALGGLGGQTACSVMMIVLSTAAASVSWLSAGGGMVGGAGGTVGSVLVLVAYLPLSKSLDDGEYIKKC